MLLGRIAMPEGSRVEQQTAEIVVFQDRHADEFARLNREWLDAFGLFEDADAKHLYSPRTCILDCGGEILIAERNGRVVGTCAVVPLSGKVFELAKLAVSGECRGEGLGRRLVERALACARDRGAACVVLLSSSKLGPALKLYESLGFRHRPMPSDQPYETADVYMELELDTMPAGFPQGS